MKPHPVRRSHQTAFTLVEMLITLVIIGALAAVALPNYRNHIERTTRTTAIKDVAILSMALERYRTLHGSFPATLGALGGGLPAIDPWGNPYQYLAIDAVPAPKIGQVRRDKNLNPLNSDYDLYSNGPDGQTQKQLTGSKARDDIVRAGNGGFIGQASEH